MSGVQGVNASTQTRIPPAIDVAAMRTILQNYPTITLEESAFDAIAATSLLDDAWAHYMNNYQPLVDSTNINDSNVSLQDPTQTIKMEDVVQRGFLQELSEWLTKAATEHYSLTTPTPADITSSVLAMLHSNTLSVGTKNQPASFAAYLDLPTPENDARLRTRNVFVWQLLITLETLQITQEFYKNATAQEQFFQKAEKLATKAALSLDIPEKVASPSNAKSPTPESVQLEGEAMQRLEQLRTIAKQNKNKQQIAQSKSSNVSQSLQNAFSTANSNWNKMLEIVQKIVSGG